jgi:hypothetical protein
MSCSAGSGLAPRPNTCDAQQAALRETALAPRSSTCAAPRASASPRSFTCDAQRQRQRPGRQDQVPAMQHERRLGNGLKTKITFLRQTSSGAAGNGLSRYRGLRISPFTPVFGFCMPPKSASRIVLPRSGFRCLVSMCLPRTFSLCS